MKSDNVDAFEKAVSDRVVMLMGLKISQMMEGVPWECDRCGNLFCRLSMDGESWAECIDAGMGHWIPGDDEVRIILAACARISNKKGDR